MTNQAWISWHVTRNNITGRHETTLNTELHSKNNNLVETGDFERFCDYHFVSDSHRTGTGKKSWKTFNSSALKIKSWVKKKEISIKIVCKSTKQIINDVIVEIPGNKLFLDGPSSWKLFDFTTHTERMFCICVAWKPAFVIVFRRQKISRMTGSFQRTLNSMSVFLV